MHRIAIRYGLRRRVAVWREPGRGVFPANQFGSQNAFNRSHYLDQTPPTILLLFLPNLKFGAATLNTINAQSTMREIKELSCLLYLNFYH